ncbi:metallophosphoesterase family protein [Paracoccus indicus]|uniref:metallophosphoesterase family protein n=1 Tax=Paracoccus indicus TaxID=2079229 RepID=UPI000D34CC5A|nr:metallophosphoesterase [Paracoccus indicus]
MTRILHLTDLHFGFHRSELIGPLLNRIEALRPDLVVVSGDITHRGLPAQMDLAQDFLSRISAPVMLMPGNHDVPLLNPIARLFWPFAGFREHFGPDLTPTAQVGQARVFALNSADPYAWQRGKIRRGEIGRVIGGIDPAATNVVALHHPMQQLPGIDKQPARRAEEAMDRLQDAGVHVVLSGHLHRWAVDKVMATGRWPRILQVQGGTALCARLSDAKNEFALLIVDGTELHVEHHVAPMGVNAFEEPVVSTYSRANGPWARV